jgi:SNF2-related domain
MKSPPFAKHIPVGCIVIKREDVNLHPDHWASKELQQWKAFWPKVDSSSVHSLPPNERDFFLPDDVQIAALKSSSLAQFHQLFQRLWIKLEFSIPANQQNAAVVRVYLLPDDVERASIPRDDARLQKARVRLFSRLDFSPQTWVGDLDGGSQSLPRPCEDDDALEVKDMSLLQMFNHIPSPHPNSDIVNDPVAQDAMFSLLQSNVPGLVTTLYPYQRRSAAMMVQRENARGQVMDPRLVCAVDQRGIKWYYDRASAVVLRQPRYYDGVTGGILAEEMGSGKTIICLSLILATRYQVAQSPDTVPVSGPPTRKRIASLADMAASSATRHSFPWRMHLDAWRSQLGYEFTNCAKVLERNPGFYLLEPPPPRREGRRPPIQPPPKKIYMSSLTLVIVPSNLVRQWQQEVQKHTNDLKVLTIIKGQPILPARLLLKYDMILFSHSRFENIIRSEGGMVDCPLSDIHFARCIVDEGHKLGSSRIGTKSNLVLGLEMLQVSSRWIATGTPAQGLFGVGDPALSVQNSISGTPPFQDLPPDSLNQTTSSAEMEKKDLDRIGAIAVLYLKARPWANTVDEPEDSLADWSVYMMQPKHSSRSKGHIDGSRAIRATLNSLIVRHKLSEVTHLLPSVDHKVVILEGSYQDKLSLNLFAMMIILNSVQSQRTDLDYFFHPRQKKNLMQLIHNMKQASFFGGSFFSQGDIDVSVDTAQKFAEKKSLPLSQEDEILLQDAISFGRLALSNDLRRLSNTFHELPIYVRDLPSSIARACSLDQGNDEMVLTDAHHVIALQERVEALLGDPTALNSFLNSQPDNQLQVEIDGTRTAAPGLVNQGNVDGRRVNLAGNTRIGDDRTPLKKASNRTLRPRYDKDSRSLPEVATPVANACIVSTASAKLSYLIDAVLKYQAEEQIIIFYENENTAFYLASVFEVLQIEHLIYARTLSTERKATYVNTFNNSAEFRYVVALSNRIAVN